jgi:hypothetical protein
MSGLYPQFTNFRIRHFGRIPCVHFLRNPCSFTFRAVRGQLCASDVLGAWSANLDRLIVCLLKHNPLFGFRARAYSVVTLAANGIIPVVAGRVNTQCEEFIWNQTENASWCFSC